MSRFYPIYYAAVVTSANAGYAMGTFSELIPFAVTMSTILDNRIGPLKRIWGWDKALSRNALAPIENPTPIRKKKAQKTSEKQRSQ